MSRRGSEVPASELSYSDLSETFWWPRRVFASRATVVGYAARPSVLRTLVTNVAIDTVRAELRPTGGPIVALCADLSRFLVRLDPPGLAEYGADEAAETGVPVIRLGGWFRSVARLERVSRISADASAHEGSTPCGLSKALRFLDRVHEAWDPGFDSIVVVGWPVYSRREPGRPLLDACTGQAILPRCDP